MANKVKVKNSVVAGRTPATGSGTPGELWTNIPDRVIGTFDATGAPIELTSHGLNKWDAAKAYQKDDLVTRNGAVYRAVAPVGPKVWAAADWIDISVDTDAVRAFDPRFAYVTNDLVAYQGKIYRANKAATGAWDATKWTLIADAAQTFTSGSIPFADTGGALTEDNAALFWDKANKRLGVGTKTPAGPFQVGAQMLLTPTGQLGIGVVPTATDPLLTVNSGATIKGTLDVSGTNATLPARSILWNLYFGSVQNTKYNLISECDLHLNATDGSGTAALLAPTFSVDPAYTGFAIVTGAITSPKIVSSAAGNKISMVGTISYAMRHSPNDLSTAANNNSNGLVAYAGHGIGCAPTALTGSAVGVTANGYCSGGTINNLYGVKSSAGAATMDKPGISHATIVSGYNIATTGTFGAAGGAGPGATVTNFYDLYLDGATINPNGQVANKWGIYQTKSGFTNMLSSQTLIGSAISAGPELLQVNSAIRATAATITVSDARLKDNISPAPDSGNTIDAIDVRSFDWKDGKGHVRWGVIAQELQATVPEAVKEGETWGVQKEELVMLLIKEVQSLRARVAQLEGK